MDMQNQTEGSEIKRRIGIMGGTFNPIHIGHLLLAENARDNFALNEILFIPSGHSYMKDESQITDKNLRLAMTALAIEDNPFFSLSAIEVERAGNTYTYETLTLLKKQNPETEYYFIVGADSLFSMESWKHSEIIFDSCIVLAAVREDKNQSDLLGQIAYLESKYKACIRQISLKEIDISSTDIRHRIAQRKSIRYMVPDKVISFIEENHLYLENNEK